jgi:hypothetical protein
VIDDDMIASISTDKKKAVYSSTASILRLEPDDLGDTGANAARQGQGGLVSLYVL